MRHLRNSALWALGALLLLSVSCSGPLGGTLEPQGLGHFNRAIDYSLSNSPGALTTTAKQPAPSFPGFLAFGAAGKASGLGNDDFVVRVLAEGEAVVACFSPGGNFAPGQNFAVGADRLNGDDPTRKNGSDRFLSQTSRPAGIDALDPAIVCANKNWRASGKAPRAKTPRKASR